jgi:hypothetical protein
MKTHQKFEFIKYYRILNNDKSELTKYVYCILGIKSILGTQNILQNGQ